MLTDIFACRYEETPIWRTFDESARRLLVQGFRIVGEQLFPYYYSDGKEKAGLKETWDSLNKQLAMELGLKDLSAPTMGFYNPQKQWVSHTNTKIAICENFVCAEYNDSVTADQFIKERLSFIEIAFRRRENEIAKINADLPAELSKAKLKSARVRRGIHVPGNFEDSVQAGNDRLNANFRSSCEELNERFRQARAKLDYHNGFIQFSLDAATTDQVERPFWALVSHPKWQNVDHDMKEALDLRDSGGRDPAFHSAKALESTLKIISDEKGWSTRKERGAGDYLNHLRAKKNGKFIDD